MWETAYETIAKEVLGDSYLDLKSFFDSFLKETREITYTVWVTEQCSKTAYIFQQIREQSDEWLQNNRNHLVMGSAFLSETHVIARYILGGEKLQIRFVLDTMNYGRTVTDLLQRFYWRLRAILNQEGDNTPEKTARAFIRDHIIIPVYMKKKQYDILENENEKLLLVNNNAKANVFHSFSAKLSELINRTRIEPSGYHYSVKVKGKPRICGKWEKAEIEYLNNRETFYIKKFPEENPACMCTIRLRACKQANGEKNVYCLIPLIIMQSLSEEQLVDLENLFFSDTLKSKKSKIEEYREECTYQNRMELVKMLMSQSALYDFLKRKKSGKYHIIETILDDRKADWNYFTFFRILGKMFSKDSLYLISEWAKTDECTAFIVKPEIFMEKAKEILRVTDLSSIDDSLELDSGSQTEMPFFFSSIEKIIFDYAADKEKEAKIISRESAFGGCWSRYELDLNRRYSFNLILNDIRGIFLSQRHRNVTLPAGTQILMLLLLMDFGYISILERYTANDDYEKNETQVTMCYGGRIEQQIRIHERALEIYTKKCVDYMEELDQLYMKYNRDWANERYFEQILSYQIDPILKNLISNKRSLISGSRGKIEPQFSELEDVLRGLRRASQRTIDWIT